MVRVVVRAAGASLAEPPPGYDPGFTDLALEDRAVVAKAEFNGLVDGRTATIFDPYGPATRGHAAKVVFQALQAAQ